MANSTIPVFHDSESEVSSILPSDLCFGQDTISAFFTNRMSLDSFLEDLLKKDDIADSVEPLTVMMYKKKKYVVEGNRRLYLLKKLESAGLVNKIKIKCEVYNETFFKQMCTTKNEGKSIRVIRGAGMDRKIETIINQFKQDKEDKNSSASSSTPKRKPKKRRRSDRLETSLPSSTMSSNEEISNIYSELERGGKKKKK